MSLTESNFNEKINGKIKRIYDYYPEASNFELAVMVAHNTCLAKMKDHGYSYIKNNIKNINDCDTGYLDYNTLTWEKILKKIFPELTLSGGKSLIKLKSKKNRKYKKSKKNRKSKRRR